jgi:hypothetical protein
VDAAGAAHTNIPLAMVIWSLWTSLWLAVAYLGARCLPDVEGAQLELSWPIRIDRPAKTDADGGLAEGDPARN